MPSKELIKPIVGLTAAIAGIIGAVLFIYSVFVLINPNYPDYPDTKQKSTKNNLIIGAVLMIVGFIVMKLMPIDK